MSVHSWTLWMITMRPCGIHANNTVTPRTESQQTYRPHAAVYSSWILEFPVQKDISQRPVNTETHTWRSNYSHHSQLCSGNKGKKKTLLTYYSSGKTYHYVYIWKRQTFHYGLGGVQQSINLSVSLVVWHHSLPGRVKHTRLANRRVMHMKIIRSTI